MRIGLAVSLASLGCLSIQAETTINPAYPHSYGANIGWINAEADGANGAVIGQAFCSGYLYGANVGWIHLGDGAPADGMAYANDSATDFGVNHDGLGNLEGFAYGANIGWINFEQTTESRRSTSKPATSPAMHGARTLDGSTSPCSRP